MEEMIEKKADDYSIEEYFHDDNKCLQILSKLKWKRVLLAENVEMKISAMEKFLFPALHTL